MDCKPENPWRRSLTGHYTLCVENYKKMGNSNYKLRCRTRNPKTGIPIREPRKKKVNVRVVLTGSGLESLHFFEQFEDSNYLHIFLSEGKMGGRVCKKSRKDYYREIKSLIHAPVSEYQQCAGRMMSGNTEFSELIELRRKKERNSCFTW